MNPNDKLISESKTLDEFTERLTEFRGRLLGHNIRDAESNSHYLAWCDGVMFGLENVTRILSDGNHIL